MIKKSKLPWIAILILNVGIMSFFFVGTASADLFSPADNVRFTPEVGIPNSEFQGGQEMEFVNSDTSYIAKYVKAIYNYGLGIVGIAAAIVIMVGGYLWVTSGGSATGIAKSKEMITGGIVGLLILFCSWIILNTINPALINLKITTIAKTFKLDINSCCEYHNSGGKDNAKAGVPQQDCESGGGTFYADASVVESTSGLYGYCAPSGCCVCTVSSGLPGLTIHTPECTDKAISGNNVSLQTCKNICEDKDAVGVNFIWGHQCKDGSPLTDKCEFEQSSTGGSW